MQTLVSLGTRGGARCQALPLFGYETALAARISRDPLGENGGINLYGYVGNSPLNRTDPTGLWFGIDDLFFMLGGGLIGVAGRYVGDLLTGNQSCPEDYWGAFVGGALAGEVLLYTANPFLAGAVGGLAGNVTTQGLKLYSGAQTELDIGSAVFDTTAGALTGFIPGKPSIAGINAGRGSFIQVFRQISTKAANGSINNISTTTAAKMFVGASYQYAIGQGAAAGALGSTAYSKIMSLLSN